MRTRAAKQGPFSTGLQILDTLLNHRLSMGVSQIAKALDMAPSSTHDNLNTLVELGYIEQDSDTKRYRLSIHFFNIIHQFANRFEIVEKLNYPMQMLSKRCRHSLYLGTLWHEQTCIIFANGVYGGSTALGSSGPAYSSSVGKALVAQLPEEQWLDYAPKPDDIPPTANSIRSVDVFIEEIKRVRANGFGWNRSESAEGIISVAAHLPYGRPPLRYALALVTSREGMVGIGESEMEEQLAGFIGELSGELT